MSNEIHQCTKTLLAAIAALEAIEEDRNSNVAAERFARAHQRRLPRPCAHEWETDLFDAGRDVYHQVTFCRLCEAVAASSRA